MNKDIDVNSLIYSLSKRVPWSVMRETLRNIEATTSSGWEPFINKVTAHLIKTKLSNKEKLELSKLPQLKDHLIEHINFSEKNINFFTFDKVLQTTLLSNIKNLSLDTSTLSSIFPYQPSDDVLDTMQYLQPQLVNVEEYPEGFALTLCTKRSTRSKEKIPLDHLSQSIRVNYGLRDEIYVMKNTTQLFYDIIFINKEKPIIEFRLDYKHGLLPETQQEAYHQTLKKFRDLFDSFSLNIELVGIDLFDLIRAMYNDETDSVVEMAFSTDDGFTDRIKLRKEGKDIRGADYHIGGTERLEGHWDPYWIAKQYDMKHLKQNVSPEVILPGQLRMLSASNEIRLRGAIFTRCSGRADSVAILSKFWGWIYDESNEKSSAA